MDANLTRSSVPTAQNRGNHEGILAQSNGQPQPPLPTLLSQKDLRSKVVEILSHTANGCLTELGYFPGMPDQLKKVEQMNQKWQTENVKLYQDNQKLLEMNKERDDKLKLVSGPDIEKISRIAHLEAEVHRLQGAITALTMERDQAVALRTTVENDYEHLRRTYTTAYNTVSHLSSLLSAQHTGQVGIPFAVLAPPPPKALAQHHLIQHQGQHASTQPQNAGNVTSNMEAQQHSRRGQSMGLSLSVPQQQTISQTRPPSIQANGGGEIVEPIRRHSDLLTSSGPMPSQSAQIQGKLPPAIYPQPHRQFGDERDLVGKSASTSLVQSPSNLISGVLKSPAQSGPFIDPQPDNTIGSTIQSQGEVENGASTYPSSRDPTQSVSLASTISTTEIPPTPLAIIRRDPEPAADVHSNSSMAPLPSISTAPNLDSPQSLSTSITGPYVEAGQEVTDTHGSRKRSSVSGPLPESQKRLKLSHKEEAEAPSAIPSPNLPINSEQQPTHNLTPQNGMEHTPRPDPAQVFSPLTEHISVTPGIDETHLEFTTVTEPQQIQVDPIQLEGDEEEEDVTLGPDGLVVLEECLPHIFDVDEDSVTHTCKFCLARYEHGMDPEPPTPFINATDEELEAHCLKEHEGPWMSLRRNEGF